ncbi:hypothetical protein Tco_0501944 [Tanacetum coccineum]
MDRSKKLRRCGLYYLLNDKIPHRQRDCNSDNKERNSSRISKDGRSTRTSHGREDHPPPNTSTGFRGNDQPRQKRRSMENGQSRRANDTIQPPPSPLKKDTQTDEKVEGKDEHLERSLESKPPKKVVIHDDHLDQTITIRGNFSVKCRSELIEILRKHADAFAWTLTDMTGIPCFIVEHELKTYPHI